jgi:hypothetical protein
MFEQVTVGWIDNGTVDGSFAGAITELLTSRQIPITSTFQFRGMNSGFDRQKFIDIWLKEFTEEWLLILDSNVVAYPSE